MGSEEEKEKFDIGTGGVEVKTEELEEGLEFLKPWGSTVGHRYFSPNDTGNE